MDHGRGDSSLLISGRVAGVSLLVDRSWLAMFIATALLCGAGVHVVMQDSSLTASIAVGFAMSVCFTLSLFVHEMAHAQVAHRMGIEIEHIRLFAGGAACRRKHVIDAPAEQFQVAAAGPVASTAMGVAALVLAAVSAMLGVQAPVLAVISFLAVVNLLIAVSNMLPVFPFDGGKLVHALFWRRAKDRSAASERLDRSGREFSRVTVMLGILIMTFGGQILLGLVVLLFGVYLLRLPSPP